MSSGGRGARTLSGAQALAAIVILAAFSVDLPAQTTEPGWRLTVGPDLPVSGDQPQLTHVEPHLAVSPRDPDHLVAASIVFREDGMTSEVLLSPDGGTSWERTRFAECAGDPWVAWGSEENVYFSCLGRGGAPTRALVHRSEDGGRSWSHYVEIPRGGGGSFDHTSLAVLPRRDSADLVYLGGMQGLRSGDRPPISAPFLAVSRDGARSFSHSGRIVWSDVMSNALNPVVVGPDEVGLPFVDFSVDGRSRIDHPRIWWVRSGDRGRSFSVPHLVADATSMRTGPVMGGGLPGSDPETLYLAYDNRRDGRQGIFVVRSVNGGVSWSDPVTVAAGDPDSVAHQNPVTAVGPTGQVGVVWYERPSGADPGCWRIRFTASADRGESFLEPVTLSSEEFCARPDGVHRARRWPFGGDYFGLVGFEDGRFRALWADSRSGIWQVRIASVTVRPD